jgi:hypothetical protein
VTILHSPGGVARPTTSSLQDAAARLAEQVERHAGYLAQLEEFTNGVERKLEQERQDAGRLRARVDELEGLLREVMSEHWGEVSPAAWIFRAREALGLDGRTGHREVNDRD